MGWFRGLPHGVQRSRSVVKTVARIELPANPPLAPRDHQVLDIRATARPPRTLSLNLAGIPTELRTRDQWVLWRWEWAAAKRTKVPIVARTGKKASSTNPDDWAPFSVVLHYLKQREGHVDGVGFVFSEHDPYCGIDLDDARDPETQTIRPEAQAIIDRFDSFTEWSISGNGVHIYIRGELPAGGNRTGKIEVYNRDRFFVVSGNVILNPGYIGDRDDELADWHRETFPKAYAPKPEPRAASTGSLSVDDTELLQACMGNAKFQRLHAGDDGDYPDGKGGTNTSDADLGFLGVIVRNGGTRAQAEDFLRRFRDRPKLDKHRTYVDMTLDRAFDGTIERYVPTPKPVVDRAAAREAARIDDLPNDIPALKAMIRELQASTGHGGEIDQLRAELEEKRVTISNLVQTFLNPHLVQSEKLALIAAINIAEQKRQRGDVRSDGSVEINAAEIANDWRAEPTQKGESLPSTNRDGSKPRMRRQTAKPIMSGLIERGIVPATPRTTTTARANAAPYRDQVWDVALPEKVSDVLAIAAAWQPEKPKVRKTWTRTPACPHCGEVHPIRRQDVCTGCGGIMAERVITPDEQAPVDFDHTADPAYADKKWGHIDTVAQPYADKKWGHSRAVDPAPVAPLLIAHGPSHSPPNGSPPAFDQGGRQ